MTSSTSSHRYSTGGFQIIPLQDEASAVSTRGHRLPSILKSRSSTNLMTLSKRPRHGSTHSFKADLEDERDRERGERPPVDDLQPSPARKSLSAVGGGAGPGPDGGLQEVDARRMSLGPEILMTPQMRSMRLIGKSNPRYKWQRYYKTDEDLKAFRRPVREYYERTNFLIAQYLYIDRLLDSSLPHDLIQEYNLTEEADLSPMKTIAEEPEASSTTLTSPTLTANGSASPSTTQDSTPHEHTPSEARSQDPSQQPRKPRVKRTPRNLYKLPEPNDDGETGKTGKTGPDENTPLLGGDDASDASLDLEAAESFPEIKLDEDEDVDSSSRVVTVAIYINLVANVVLLAAKIAVIVLTSSLSVLASLVDAALDFLSTAIVWTTTLLISRQDQYAYPVGRRRLEPVGVLVFSVIMITSFFQVGLECFNRLTSGDTTIVALGAPAIAIMAGTVVVKGFCYLWCRLVKNSSVQALAQDAMTDVVFNTFSIIFPLVGYYAKVWWLDALGGLLLSAYVIFNWSLSASEHIRNLSGAAASADQRNVLLYLTMRFAKTIRFIQGLQAYHAGDKLNVEVDIVLDENMNLKDSHDLSESLQYVLESVPTVDRAFVHADYKRVNLPSHMNQQE